MFRAAPSAASGDPIRLRSDSPAFNLGRLIAITHAPGVFDRLYAVRHKSIAGGFSLIWSVDLDDDTPFHDAAEFLTFSDLTTAEDQGLRGLAFHPDYQNNRRLYVARTVNSGGNQLRIAEFTSIDDDQADQGSERIILDIPTPFANHQGGWIGFSPLDGYLYVVTGDGGSVCDPGQRAQDLTNQLLGKILRLDVNGDDFPADRKRNYAIPPQNPFVGQAGDDEILHFGLHDPVGGSFDRLTGDFYFGDRGQNAREEINWVPAGSPGGINFGWDCLEGTLCATFASFQCFGTVAGCDCLTVDAQPPLYEYDAIPSARDVVGGVVYRGCGIPELYGTYLFGDWSRRIWSFNPRNGVVSEFIERTVELDPPEGGLSGLEAFGEDAHGELYAAGGGVLRIFADTPSGFTAPDCDANLLADPCELLDGSGIDADESGVLDVCELCPWDCTPPGGNGVVNIDDLLAVIDAFSTQDAACDVAPTNPDGTVGNQVVNIDDLLAVVGTFGPCPRGG